MDSIQRKSFRDELLLEIYNHHFENKGIPFKCEYPESEFEYLSAYIVLNDLELIDCSRNKNFQTNSSKFSIEITTKGILYVESSSNLE